MQSSITVIKANGFFTGTKEEHVEKLLEMLKKHTLHPAYEALGDFVGPISEVDRIVCGPAFAKAWEGGFQICGNFVEFSWNFNIYTKDMPLVETLMTAVQGNKQKPSYARAKYQREALLRVFSGGSPLTAYWPAHLPEYAL